MKRFLCAFGVCLTAAGIAFALAYWICDEPAPPGIRRNPAPASGAKVKLPRPEPTERPSESNSTPREVSVLTPTSTASGESSLTPDENRTVEAIQTALDEDSLEKLSAQLASIMASTNALVRKRAVEALQWFGQKALSELTGFMTDRDEDVRSTAVDAWTAAVSQLEVSDDKATIVRKGLMLVNDRRQLEAMIMQVDDMPDIQKLDVLTKVIAGQNETAAEVARAHYKFWTEEDYVDLDAAQRWLDSRHSSSQE